VNALENSQARAWLSRSSARVSSMSDRLPADCRHGATSVFPLLQQSAFRRTPVVAVDCKNILRGVNYVGPAFRRTRIRKNARRDPGVIFRTRMIPQLNPHSNRRTISRYLRSGTALPRAAWPERSLVAEASDRGEAIRRALWSLGRSDLLLIAQLGMEILPRIRAVQAAEIEVSCRRLFRASRARHQDGGPDLTRTDRPSVGHEGL
jgi:hypothetical protein